MRRFYFCLGSTRWPGARFCANWKCEREGSRMGNLEKPVSVLSGVGVRTAAAFEKLSIRTLGELLRHFPTRYENRGVVTALADGVPGKPQSYILTVASQPNRARLPAGGRSFGSARSTRALRPRSLISISPMSRINFKSARPIAFTGACVRARAGSLSRLLRRSGILKTCRCLNCVRYTALRRG